MIAADLKAWQARHSFTYDTAAEELGIGRTTYYDFLKREGELPRMLLLACRAVDAGLNKE